MKCAACHRPIAKPALVLAGMPFGPVCAQKVLAAAGQKFAERAQPRGTDHQPSTAQRDELTRDLFAEVASA